MRYYGTYGGYGYGYSSSEDEELDEEDSENWCAWAWVIRVIVDGSYDDMSHYCTARWMRRD